MLDVLNPQLLSAFVPTFFMVSITPGMCMTLALSLGIALGVRRALWMMVGELLGVGLVAVAAAVGVAAVMLQHPQAFNAFRYAGGAYLGFLGVQLWLSRGTMALSAGAGSAAAATPVQLALQGFVTAVANPKGWAFFVALLPPFLDDERALAPQLALLVAIILLLEFTCLLLYASGGRSLGRLLQDAGRVRWLNRAAGTLLVGVGGWLALG